MGLNLEVRPCCKKTQCGHFRLGQTKVEAETLQWRSLIFIQKTMQKIFHKCSGQYTIQKYAVECNRSFQAEQHW